MPPGLRDPTSLFSRVGVLLEDTSAGRMLADTEVLNPDLTAEGRWAPCWLSGPPYVRVMPRKTQILPGKCLNGAAE